MRKFIVLALCAISLSLTSCKEDFDVAAPYKNITLVYAMLNIGDTVNNLDDDTAHYIRIQKAFMSQDKSAIDMAKVSDSNFYADGVLEVRIKEISNNTVLDNILLSRVDMDKEGYPKEPGNFFTGPNYAYKFKKKLNRNYTYRLVIKNTITGDVDSGETALIPTDTTRGNFFVSAFGDPSIPSPPSDIAFPKTTSISFKYSLIVSVPEPAKTLEGVIRFWYWEKDNNSGGTEKRKYVDFPFAKTVITNNSATELTVHNSAFYDFFKESLGVAPANVLRYLDSCDIYVYAGSQDFVTYQSITQAQLTGITSNEIKPIFTNLRGTDVYGLFTTRAIRVGRNIPISGNTLDSLYLNPKTAPTGIQPEPSDK